MIELSTNLKTKNGTFLENDRPGWKVELKCDFVSKLNNDSSQIINRLKDGVGAWCKAATLLTRYIPNVVFANTELRLGTETDLVVGSKDVTTPRVFSCRSSDTCSETP